jgi:hypothetical protein
VCAEASKIDATGDAAVAADRYLVEDVDSGGSVTLVERILVDFEATMPLIERHGPVFSSPGRVVRSCLPRRAGSNAGGRLPAR